MSDLDLRLAALSPEKRALFERMLKKQGLNAQPQTALANDVAAPVASDKRSAASAPGDDATNGDRYEMNFSLFFFSEDGSESKRNKYELLIESAKFADKHDFSAVWTPERHFHAFGGPYPNPSVIAAALAMITRKIELRAGSVVLPLHNPLRVVEEWAVVDNLSEGRVSISFASGWHLDDFVLGPDKYADRKESIYRDIELVKKLWAGEALACRGVDGREVSVVTYPRPLNRQLSVWVTSAGNAETFRLAGESGANILTGLTGQQVHELAAKLKLYREARAQNGHDPATGKVALMLHTLVGDQDSEVREQVRQPMYDYLRVNLGLHEKMAQRRQVNIGSEAFSADDEETLLSFAFDRYWKGGALFGTPETCLQMVARLKEIGVTEIACLVDFGLDNATVLEGLTRLDQLRARCAAENRH
jgi:natural product biosynthesis luciferase-like monooxygenase protein